MGRKGKRGDDSEEDEKPVAMAPDTGTKGGKTKKSKGVDDDEEVAEVSHKLKGAKIRGDDDDAGASKSKKTGATKSRGKDEDEEVPKGGKKSKKGRRGDDSDADDAEDTGKAAKGVKEAPAAKGKSKGKHAKDDSDDNEGGKSNPSRKSVAVSHADGSDDEEGDSEIDDNEGAHVRTGKTASKPAAAAPAAGKKSKKGKKGRHNEEDDDDSDDDIDPLRAVAGKGKGRLAALSDSDSEPHHKKKAAETNKTGHPDLEDAESAAPAGKKGKKARRRDEDDADFLPGLASSTTVQEPQESVLEKAEPPVVSLAAPTAIPPLPAGPATVPPSPLSPPNTEREKADAVADGPAVPGTRGEDDAKGDDVDFAAIKKKKKKKAVFDLDEGADTSMAAASGVDASPAAPAPAPPATDVFYGEASMGSATGPELADDMPPEIAKIFAKIASGTDLSNKERRAKKQWDEEQATKVPLKAGYGAGKTVTEGDEYGISAFSVSQSAKLMAEDSAAAENSKDILVENFTITAHKKELFKNATLKVAHGHRYGLVGPNGQGKTTILKHIAARELAIPPRISILYVEQEVVADETPAVQAVLRADKKRAGLLEEETTLLAELEAADAKEGRGERGLSDSERARREDRLAAVYEELSAMRADAAESTARKILSGLGFTADMQEQPTKHFSGGWRMRISLARALFMQPDLLLLDEPTNHLDLNAVIWLEDYLQKWKSTLLIVSHDQDFLSSVVTDIVHLEEKKLWYYKGNHDDFKEMHAQKVAKQLKDYEKQQKMLKAMKDKGTTNKDAKDKAVSRAKREAAAGAKKDKKGAGGSGARDDDDEEDAKGRDLILKPREYTVRFTFNDPPPLAPPILSVSDMSFRYGDRYPWLFKNVNCGIDQSSRIAIVGPNGVGKSTFLSVLIGDLPATLGDVPRNRFLRVGKYSQHFVDVLPMDKTPVEYLQSKFSEIGYQECRTLLGRFGLEGHAHTIASSELSGGQKARVVFASLCLEAPHVMVLDEPSNNLDAESIDALADAITKFQGGIVLVSHDARLIRNTDCQLWVCDKQNVKPFEGTLDDYKRSLLESIHEEEDKLDVIMEKRRKEEEDARLALLREMKQKQLARKTGAA